MLLPSHVRRSWHGIFNACLVLSDPIANALGKREIVRVTNPHSRHTGRIWWRLGDRIRCSSAVDFVPVVRNEPLGRTVIPPRSTPNFSVPDGLCWKLISGK
jgi:hypothetical protein